MDPVSRVTFLQLITGRKLKQSVIKLCSYYPQMAAFRYVGANISKYSWEASLLRKNDLVRSSLYSGLVLMKWDTGKATR